MTLSLHFVVLGSEFSDSAAPRSQPQSQQPQTQTQTLLQRTAPSANLANKRPRFTAKRAPAVALSSSAADTQEQPPPQQPFSNPQLFRRAPPLPPNRSVLAPLHAAPTANAPFTASHDATASAPVAAPQRTALELLQLIQSGALVGATVSAEAAAQPPPATQPTLQPPPEPPMPPELPSRTIPPPLHPPTPPVAPPRPSHLISCHTHPRSMAGHLTRLPISTQWWRWRRRRRQCVLSLRHSLGLAAASYLLAQRLRPFAAGRSHRGQSRCRARPFGRTQRRTQRWTRRMQQQRPGAGPAPLPNFTCFSAAVLKMVAIRRGAVHSSDAAPRGFLRLVPLISAVRCPVQAVMALCCASCPHPAPRNLRRRLVASAVSSPPSFPTSPHSPPRCMSSLTAPRGCRR